MCNTKKLRFGTMKETYKKLLVKSSCKTKTKTKKNKKQTNKQKKTQTTLLGIGGEEAALERIRVPWKIRGSPPPADLLDKEDNPLL
jgi:hypothetical protein